MKTSPTCRRSAEDLIAPFRITSGRGFSLARITGGHPVVCRGRQGSRRGRSQEGRQGTRGAAGQALRAGPVVGAADLPGDGCGGKDGTIKHVMSGVNPQGCQVTSFKAPSQEELDHDFLWRCFRGAARARAHRHLQPLVLRRGARRARPPRVARGAAAPAEARDAAHLGRALRGHPRLRALSRPQRHGRSASSSCTFPRRSSGSASSRDSTSPRRTGSSPPSDVRERRTGTSTCARTRR